MTVDCTLPKRGLISQTIAVNLFFDQILRVVRSEYEEYCTVDGEEGENMDCPNRWEMELNLLQEHFSPVHLVGTIPTFHDLHVSEPVDVLVYVRNKGGKTSEGYPFKYTPGK